MNLSVCLKSLAAALAVGVIFSAGCDNPSALNQSTANVKHITQGDFETEVTRCTNPIVADFYATWCGPCRVLSPMLDRLAGNYTGTIKFVKINVDESPGLAQNFQVQVAPTILFFRDGKVADRYVQAPDEAALKAKLAAFANGK